MWKILGFTLLGLVGSVVAFGAWVFTLIDQSAVASEQSSQLPEDLAYYQQRVTQQRGRILVVVTSETTMGTSGKSTGYEHTELARAYYVFTVNGFEVDIASPRGGEPRAIIDAEDMGPLDYAFLNDAVAMEKVRNSLPLASVDDTDYQAVFFVGGKGAMFDFPNDPHVHRLVQAFAMQEKLVGAVCHGPAALANVTLPGGTPFLQGKPVTGFTNEEELFLIPDAAEIFPFLLEDRLRERGAEVSVGLPYLENIAVADGLVTGQNPWSVYATAETMIHELGFTPRPRVVTGDENSVDVLLQYHLLGGSEARETVDAFVATGAALNRNLVIMHGIVAAMEWQLKPALELFVLAQHMKTVTTQAQG